MNVSRVSGRGANVGYRTNTGRKSAHSGTSAFNHKQTMRIRS